MWRASSPRAWSVGELAGRRNNVNERIDIAYVALSLCVIVALVAGAVVLHWHASLMVAR